MARERTVVVRFAGDATELNRTASQAGEALGGVEVRVGALANRVDQVGTGMLAGGATIAAGFGLAAKGAADLEQGVANIATIKPEIDTSAVFKSLNEIQTRVPQTASELAAGVYNIFSSLDVTQEQSLRLVEQFAKGATAAQTDTETFGTAIIGVLNSYGKSVEDAGHVSDVFFNTVKLGVVSGEELAGNLGVVTAAAKAAGVDIDQLGGFIAGVTKEGGPAAQNLNNLANLLNKISGTQAQDALAKIGIATVDATGKFRPLLDVLADLRGSLAQMTEAQRANALQAIFPDVQARQAAQVLLSQLDFVRGAIDDNTKAAGVAEAAYTTMAATASSQFKLLHNDAAAAGNALGVLLLPDILRVTGAVKDGITWFNNLDDGTKHLIVRVGEGAAGFLLLGGSIIKTTGYVRDLTTAVGDVIGAFAKKEAAKKTLTAANETLAGSAAKTAGAFGSVRTAAILAAPEIAAVAAVTVVTGGAAVILTLGLAKLADALDRTGQRAKDNTQAWNAASFAIAHGADATNDAVAGFARYVASTGGSIKSTDDLAAAWDRYVDGQKRAGNQTSGLIPALTGQQQAQQRVNVALGEGRIAGAAYDENLAALRDELTRVNVAMGNIPPAAEQARKAIADTGSAAGVAGYGLVGLDDGLGHIVTQAHAAQAAVLDLNAAYAALGSENSKLGGLISPLQARIDVLQDKQKNGTALTQDEATELETLIEARRRLGTTMGENAAVQRAQILAMVGLNTEFGTAVAGTVSFTDAILNQRANIPPLVTGLVGISDGYGAIATAADLAAAAADRAARSLAKAVLLPPPPPAPSFPTNPIVGPNAGQDYGGGAPSPGPLGGGLFTGAGAARWAGSTTIHIDNFNVPVQQMPHSGDAKAQAVEVATVMVAEMKRLVAQHNGGGGGLTFG